MMAPKLSLVVIGLALAGCDMTAAELQSAIAQRTEQICRFRPVAITISSVVQAFTGYPSGTIVEWAANAICQTPPTATLRRRGVAEQTRIIRLPNGATAVVKGYQQ